MKWFFALLLSASLWAQPQPAVSPPEAVPEAQPVVPAWEPMTDTTAKPPAPATAAPPASTAPLPVAEPDAATTPAPATAPVEPSTTTAPQPAQAGAEAAAPASADLTPLLKTLKLNYRKGNYEAADKTADLALAISPLDYESTKYKAMIALRMGRLDAAGEYFKLAATAEGRESELDFHYGAFLLARGDTAGAETQFRRFSEYGALDPYRDRMRRYAEFVRSPASRANARAVLASESAAADGEPMPGTLAVLPFVVSESADREPLSRALCDMLTTDLSQVSRFTLLERGRVQALSSEIALGQTGVLDDKASERAGRLLKAERVVGGTLEGKSGGPITLRASLFSQDGAASGPEPVQGDFADLLKLQKKLVFKVLDALGVVLTDGERRKIETVPTENVLAFLAYGKGLEAEDRGDYAGARTHYADAKRMDPRFSEPQTALSRVDDFGTVPADLSQPETPAVKAAPVFTAGGLNFSAASGVSVKALNAVNASFMPEKEVSAEPLARPAEESLSPAFAEQSVTENQARNPYVDAYNVGVSGGATSVRVRVPIPVQP